MGAPAFWDNNERAQKHIAKLNTLKRPSCPWSPSRRRSTTPA